MAVDTGQALQALNRSVIECQRCPRLRAHCTRIASARKREFADWTYWGRPVPGFGDPHARLLIVGLAPAAHGANRTGRMFTGDSSGDWLYEALHRFGFASQAGATSRDDGLLLSDCYITASVRCAPPDNRPLPAELENCGDFLARELALLDHVQVVLTLGRIAWERWLRTTGRWAGSDRPGFAHAAVHPTDPGRWLVCSYHPSRQNTNTGRLTREMWYDVFAQVRHLIDAASA